MKTKVTQILACVLSVALLLTSVPANMVFAQDNTVGENETYIAEEQQEVKETEEIQSEVQSETTFSLKYFLIDQPQLAAPGTQNIVVSLSDETEAVDDMKLISTADDGRKMVWDCSKNAGRAYLFSREFTEAEAGEYVFDKLVYSYDGQEKEMILADSGIEASFMAAPQAALMSAEPVPEECTVRIEEAEEAEAAVEHGIELAAEEVQPRKDDDKLVIVLDPGHDGISPGAQANGYSEEVLVLKIAKYCKEALEQHAGVEVYMTREDMNCPADIESGHSSREGECLKKRVQIAEDKNADIFVSLHLNAFGNSGANGAEVYYPTDNWKPEVGQDGEGVAESIQNELVSLGLYDRGIKSQDSTDESTYPDGSLEDYYAVIRESKEAGFPGLIVEHAFITSTNDISEYLSTESGLKSLGEADARGIANYYDLKTGDWEYKNGKYYYKNPDGSYMQSQWALLGGYWYYFGDDKAMVTDWQLIGGHWYYFDYSGAMVTGWQAIGGYWYYLNTSGEMLTGFQKIGNDTYYFNGSGHMLTGWQLIEDTWYYFNYSGEMLTGWQAIGGYWYYFNTSGEMLTGFQKIGNDTYYFNGSGHMVTGWQLIEDTWYYFNYSGVMVTGWQAISGCWYYFNTSGEMLTGLQKIGSDTYYFNGSGHMVTGWQLVENTWYYFNTSGAMVTGWQAISGYWYYFNTSGEMLTGLQKIGNNTYYFNGSGHMLTGWQLIDSAWYYFYSDGSMATGWQTLGQNTFYLGTDGVMVTGWQEIEGKTYYFNSSGYLLKGKHVIDGKECEFDPETGEYLSQETLSGWVTKGEDTYYYDENGNQVTGWQEIEGKTYYFGQDNKLVKGLTKIEGKTYYLDPDNGEKLTGWQIVNSQWSFFDENGVLDESKKRELVAIEGESSVTAEDLAAFYRSNKGDSFPSDVYKPGGVETIDQFCEIYVEEAAKENVKAEIAFAQCMLETAWLAYGGTIKAEQFNFAGLGATGGGVTGADFSKYGEEGVRMGIRAHIQHLKAYASETITKETLKEECVDERFQYVTPGSAKYVEWLGQKENPQGKGWAVSRNYGVIILKLADEIQTVK